MLSRGWQPPPSPNARQSGTHDDAFAKLERAVRHVLTSVAGILWQISIHVLA